MLQKSSINLLKPFDVCIAPNNNLFVTMAFLNISQTSNLGCPMSTPPFIPNICPIQPNLVSILSSILDIFCWIFLFCCYHLHKSRDSVPLNCGIFHYWCYYLHMFWGIFICCSYMHLTLWSKSHKQKWWQHGVHLCVIIKLLCTVFIFHDFLEC